MKNGLTVQEIKKTFSGHTVLDEISFSLPEGEILALLGPSGCGKSTLLSLIAGLETPDEGSISWNGQNLADTPPHRRSFGLMFQDYALFPHLNVADNLAFGLRMSGWNADKIHTRVTALLEMVGLPGFDKRDVNSLSGGEQQRVALARSLAPEPRLLMLDEPLGALDRTLREYLLTEIRRVLRTVHQTAIYVTHDQEEAFSIADQILLMQRGRIMQSGKPEEIYAHPGSTFAARFLGMENLLPAQIEDEDGKPYLHCALGKFPFPQRRSPARGTILLRPDAISLAEHGHSRLDAVLREKTFLGSQQKAILETKNTLLRVNFPQNIPLPQPGERLALNFDPKTAFVFFDEPFSAVNG